uniref:DHHA1 domain-containing protein n=1 Tax=Rhizorhabdus sp. TaxID=1968843 RepID=UPI0035AFEEB2
IYHSPCDDGFGAAWAVWKRWGDAVEYVPASYGQPAPDVSGRNVLMGDFSYKYDVLSEMSFKARSMVILDHHKTAQEELSRLPMMREATIAEVIATFMEVCWTQNMPEIAAFFDMNRSGARMVWDFCHPGAEVPELIRFIEDRDLWRFDYPQTRAFTLWLRSHPYDFATWDRIAAQLEGADAAAILAQALAIEAFYDQKVAEMVRQVQLQRIDGHLVPVVNCSWAFASDVAHELLKAHKDAPFAAVYYDRGDGARTYSLRSEDDRADVSAVAKRYGGGGHRNAAGFEVPRP